MSCDFSGDAPAGTRDRQKEAAPANPERVSCPPTLASVEERETCRPRLAADCLILTGPTAAGKSAIALRMAQRLEAEIVSVDSVAVYRGLDIGSAKPSAEEQRLVPHHALDLVPASETFNVAAWLAAATEAVEAIRSRGRRILFVGGTPLYLKALREGFDTRPPADAALRAAITERLEQQGAAALHRELSAHDPLAAARIHPNDARRLVRGLEVALSSRSALACEQNTWNKPDDESLRVPMLIVDVPRALLAERIAARVQAMFASGLVAEVEAAEASTGIGPTARQAAGYSEVLAMLAGTLSRDEAIEQTIRRTRQLAKRQRTWLRSFQNTVWVAG
ncbi:MAG: tRNA (adenosine(37)-N6)-dimethylallyltransferase MiaA [Pirellulales bacterium]|jgi:tRNA dimethylallyltransferase